MRLLGVLALTHSSRRVDPERSSLRFLTERFASPDRLQDLPPFEGLGPPPTLYSGAVSLFRVWVGGEGPRLEPLGRVKHRDKIQHAVVAGERDLWVGYEHRLEHWRLPAPIFELPRLRDRDLARVRRIEHPHLAGLHTVDPCGGGRALVSCSAPDAVLVVRVATGEVERVLAMPAELYGRGYELTPEMDLRRHYVDDDHQTTHVNSASAIDGGRRVVISTLIQGAVGVFDLEDGGYRELARGFVGCHGARASDAGEIYFADSVEGALVFLGRDGAVARRFPVGSRWLHDVQQIAGGVYAFALADANELRLYDVERGVLLERRKFVTWPVEGLFGLARRAPFWLGNSVQALSFYPAPAPFSSGSAATA